MQEKWLFLSSICSLIPAIAMVAPVEARERDWSVGAFALVGFSDTSHTENATPGIRIVEQDSDTAGINNGAGLWLNYDLARKLNMPLSIELSSTWRYRHDENFLHAVGGNEFVANNDTMTLDTMASLLYHFKLGEDWSPYLGGGIGAAYMNNTLDYQFGSDDRTIGSSNAWNMAWQLQGGINYALSDQWDFRVDYRYIDLGAVPTMATGEQCTVSLRSCIA